MARTIQQGMLYFNLDVDFFQDIKIRRIMRACGPQSISILIWLLSSIFRDEGYYVRWHEDMPFLISDDIGVNDGAVMETFKKSLQVGFFDPDMLEKYSILTSHGIQKRFFEMAKRRIYVNYDSRYLLTDISEYKNVKNVYKNSIDVSEHANVKNVENSYKDKINVDKDGINVDKNEINVNNNSVNVYHNKQSKVKERKGKESRSSTDNDDLKKLISSYQNNIHPVSGHVEREKLIDLLDTYGVDIVLKAIERAVMRGKRNIGYIIGILNNWQTNGYDDETTKKDSTPNDSQYDKIPF